MFDRVTHFVPQKLETALAGGSFRFEHLVSFEPNEPRMREIERHGHAGNALRRKPFFRQPEMRIDSQAFREQFMFHLFDQPCNPTFFQA